MVIGEPLELLKDLITFSKERIFGSGTQLSPTENPVGCGKNVIYRQHNTPMIISHSVSPHVASSYPHISTTAKYICKHHQHMQSGVPIPIAFPSKSTCIAPCKLLPCALIAGKANWKSASFTSASETAGVLGSLMCLHKQGYC